MCDHVFVDSPNHTLQSFSWTALGEVVSTVGNHVLHT